jgi:hypothetical protein
MPTATSTSLADNLRETNLRLRSQLDLLGPSHVGRGYASPTQMAGLLSELLRAGAWLREGIPPAPDLELEVELGEYRRNVERLRELLPFIHDQLLAERARIEDERRQVRLAGEWASGSRRTL